MNKINIKIHSKKDKIYIPNVHLVSLGLITKEFCKLGLTAEFGSTPNYRVIKLLYHDADSVRNIVNEINKKL